MTHLSPELHRTGIEGEIIPSRHGGAVGVAEQQRDRRRRWRGTFRISPRQKVRIARACPSPMLRMVPLLILGRIWQRNSSPAWGAVGVAEQQRDHAKHIGGAPAGCRNLSVMPGRNPAPI
jgi:hypothetical protein